MTSNRKNLVVFTTGLLVFALPAWIYLQQTGWSEESLGLTLRVSARLALLIYLVIFVARPLRNLGVTSMLAKNRRYIGISFAAIMTVHLYLLITLNGFALNVPGGITFGLIYLMLVTSFDGPAAALGPKRWRILHKTGIYVIGVVFAVTMIAGIRERPNDVIYYPIAGLALIAIGIRVTAWMKKRRASAYRTDAIDSAR